MASIVIMDTSLDTSQYNTFENEWESAGEDDSRKYNIFENKEKDKKDEVHAQRRTKEGLKNSGEEEKK